MKMKLIFFIKSGTLNLENYNIKDIPGSSGRLDVISRAILAAIVKEKDLERDLEIWVFLDNYGTFVFDSNSFDNDIFPKNEILLSDYFVKYIKNRSEPELLNENPLSGIQYLNITIYEAINNFLKLNYQIFVLNENGEDFCQYFTKLNQKSNTIFIVGNQSGEIVNSKDLKSLNLKFISLGGQSYLASSVVRLIKLNLSLMI